MKKILSLYCMMWVSIVFSGDQLSRIAVFPDLITDQDLVTVAIADTLSPCIAVNESITPFYHLSESNHITFVFVGIGYNPCINLPDFGVFFDTPVLPEGDYTLQSYVVSGPNSLPVTIDDPLGAQFGNLIQFSVQGTQITPVPSLNFQATALLILLFLLVISLRLKS